MQALFIRFFHVVCLCGDLLATGNPCADRRTDRL